MSVIQGEPRAEAVATIPTRVRVRVTAMIVALGMITYLDRACISTLAPTISQELSLDPLPSTTP